MCEQIDIIHGKENYTVIIDGKVYCTVDTMSEARKEVLEYLTEHGE